MLLVHLLKRVDDIEFNFEIANRNFDNPLQPEGVHTFNYGSAYTQLQISNVPAVHDLGFNGTGVTICVMDAGFDNLPHKHFHHEYNCYI